LFFFLFKQNRLPDVSMTSVRRKVGGRGVRQVRRVCVDSQQRQNRGVQVDGCELCRSRRGAHVVVLAKASGRFHTAPASRRTETFRLMLATRVLLIGRVTLSLGSRGPRQLAATRRAGRQQSECCSGLCRQARDGDRYACRAEAGFPRIFTADGPSHQRHLTKVRRIDGLRAESRTAVLVGFLRQCVELEVSLDPWRCHECGRRVCMRQGGFPVLWIIPSMLRSPCRSSISRWFCRV